MNTPNPCNTCAHLYYDVITEDDPNSTAICMVKGHPTNGHCPQYTTWKTT